MVELYPGLFIEEAKKRMDPGCGGCPPYTVGRAVFSDAVTLVRSDRFYTIVISETPQPRWLADFLLRIIRLLPSLIGAWPKSHRITKRMFLPTQNPLDDLLINLQRLGGSMLYKLIHRAVPGWFPYNSLHVMQPMFTRKMNQQIAEEIGTIEQYTLADPSPPRQPIVLMKHAIVCKVLKDQKSFIVPWLPAMNDIWPGTKDLSSYMLSADKPANTAQRVLVGDALYGRPEFEGILSDSIINAAKACLKSDTFALGSSILQIDIIREYVSRTSCNYLIMIRKLTPFI